MPELDTRSIQRAKREWSKLLGAPEAGELTQGAAVEGETDDWGEVVTR